MKNKTERLNKTKRLLEKYLPNITKIINIKDNALSKMIENELKRCNELSKSKKINIPSPQSLLERVFLVNSSYIGNIEFLDFIDSLSNNFYNIVSEDLKPKVKKTIYNMFCSVESRVFEIDGKYINNPSYLNFCAEIIFAYSIITRDSSKKLVDIERTLPNGKNVDFVFNNESGDIYIEIVNYHSIDFKDLETLEDYDSYLSNKLNQKFADKTKTLKCEENYILNDEGCKTPFILASFIWTEEFNNIILADIFKQLNNKYINVFPFLSLFAYKDKEGKYAYDICYLSDKLESSLK